MIMRMELFRNNHLARSNLDEEGVNNNELTIEAEQVWIGLVVLLSSKRQFSCICVLTRRIGSLLHKGEGCTNSILMQII